MPKPIWKHQFKKDQVEVTSNPQQVLDELQAESDNTITASRLPSQMTISNKTALHALQGQSVSRQLGARDQICEAFKRNLLFYGHLGKLSDRSDYVEHILARRKKRRHHNITKRLAFEHFTRKSEYCNISPGQETKKLFTSLEDCKEMDLKDVEVFMGITRWSENFPGADKKALRNTLRAMQKLFTNNFHRKIHDPYKIQFGTGDLSEE